MRLELGSGWVPPDPLGCTSLGWRGGGKCGCIPQVPLQPLLPPACSPSLACMAADQSQARNEAARSHRRDVGG